MADYEINEYGEIIRKKVVQNQIDPVWEEYQKLEYEVLNNHHNPTKDPVKIARYNELKKQLNIEKSVDALRKAKEKLKQQIITSDKSNDKSLTFAAMAQFKEKDE